MKQFKSGKFQNQGFYKSFQPSEINRQWILDDMEIQQLLSKADLQLGRLDTYSVYSPNIDLFISMHVRKEATQSSKIEGTQTNIEESLLDKEDIKTEKREDWEEVQNYIYAMNYAVKRMEEIPFSIRLIKETHKLLLRGVRGQNKMPGEFRTSQNWIGGASINDAKFVPPIHTTVPELMGDLEKFSHDTRFFPDLLKVALIHYQFETIHPFLDGNGRIGRLMIALYLVEKKILKSPILYLSDFFEKHRTLYYDNLMNVRLKNDLKQWMKFFLVGIESTASQGIITFDAILKLKREIEEQILQKKKRSGLFLKIMDTLYVNPVIYPHQVSKITLQSTPSSYKILDEMVEMGILKEITGGQRGKIFAFSRYIDLFAS